MNIEIIKQHGFKQSSILPYLYDFNSEDWMKRLFHILIDESGFIFRGQGRTIAIIKDEEHLIQLIDEYELRRN